MPEAARQNRGEWSEAYAFLKLVADGAIFSGDAELNSNSGRKYPVVRIVHLPDRPEERTRADLIVDRVVVASPARNAPIDVPREVFRREANYLLNAIRRGGDKPAFAVPRTEAFLASLGIRQLKADGGRKSDMSIVIHDSATCSDQALEFSIKSLLGSAPTLLNASKVTNLIYELSHNPVSAPELAEFNGARTKITEKIALLHRRCRLKFRECASKMLECNLITIDSLLPQILGELLLHHYVTGTSSIEELADALTAENPLGFYMALGHPYYPAKIRKLLVAAALGMKPGCLWDGRYDVTGGSLVVKQNGEIVLYHVYNWNEFEDFLMRKTVIDRPSQTRHGYGQIYAEAGRQLICLNFQIRFHL